MQFGILLAFEKSSVPRISSSVGLVSNPIVPLAGFGVGCWLAVADLLHVCHLVNSFPPVSGDQFGDVFRGAASFPHAEILGQAVKEKVVTEVSLPGRLVCVV